MRAELATQVESFIDSFGNRCTRFVAPQGTLCLSNSTLLEDPGFADQTKYDARELPVQELPTHLLGYLLHSRYCEVDRFATIASALLGGVALGWGRIPAICDWVHTNVNLGYQYAAPRKRHWKFFSERTGVCRDFQHLAVTLCRALHIPARYATGYLGDIRVPASPAPDGTSAHGLKCTSKTVGGLSTRVTTVPALAAC